MVKGVELKAAGTDTVPDKIIFTMFLQTILSRTRVARGNVGKKNQKVKKNCLLTSDFMFFGLCNFWEHLRLSIRSSAAKI